MAPECPGAETVQAFVDGRLDETGRRELLDHADACPLCRAAIVDGTRQTTVDGAGAASPSPSHAPPAGTRLGRFVVLEPLGLGAMGVVVSAYDPDLGRKAAVKLVRPDADTRLPLAARTARLQREAHAMARLSHPNVVTVYEVGTLDDDVFVAMEMVEGGTLADWLARGPHELDAVIAMFRRIGDGLAAAHAAGLVHRDLKPDNVLLHDDGRPRISDFGLAGVAAAAGTDEAPPSLALTQAGARVGTPRYMAPEQHAGQPVDARVDQFAFCVMLHQALHGALPFAGDRYDELAANVAAGRRTEPPDGRKLPTWLARVVRRGLATRPEDRYPSMAALLAELGRDRRRTRGLVLLAAAALAVVAAALFVRARARVTASCGGGERKLRGIWDGDVRARARAAFLATGKPYAERAWRGAEARLDHHAAAWIAMHADACQATRDGEQSAQALDLRMSCLTGRLTQLRALTGLLARADAEVVQRATSATDVLAPVDECADLNRLSASMPPPREPWRRGGVDAGRALAAEAKVNFHAGKFAAAQPLALAALALAHTADDPASETEALLVRGRVELSLGDVAAGRRSLFAATVAAARAGHLEAAADAHTDLLKAAVIAGDLEEARRAAALATAEIDRLGDDPRRRALLLLEEGHLFAATDDLAQARARYQQALALVTDRFGAEAPELVDILIALALAERRAGDLAKALPLLERALVIEERTYGPDHPTVARVLDTQGGMLIEAKQVREGLAHVETALAIYQGALDPDHPLIVGTLYRIAYARITLGELDEGTAGYERVVAIAERAPSLDLLLYRAGLAEALLEQGRLDRAREVADAGLTSATEMLGPEHSFVASLHMILGEIAGHARDHPEAERHLRLAVTMLEKALGPDHPEVAASLLYLAWGFVDAGRVDEAQAAHVRAAAILGQREPIDPAVHWVGGRILAARGRHAEAIAAYERARAASADLPEHPRHLVDLADSLLAAGRPGDAVTALERCLALLERDSWDPLLAGQGRFLLAQALVASGGDRTRAIALAGAAQRDFAAAGGRAAPEQAAIGAWLSRNPR